MLQLDPLGIIGVAMLCLLQTVFSTKATGVGIGLTVSKTIIETHKGKLWAENEPDGGAFFVLRYQCRRSSYQFAFPHDATRH